MVLSAAAERSLQLAAELDSRLTTLRHTLRAAKRGAATGASQAATTVDDLPPLGEMLPATTRQLAEATPLQRSGSIASSAQQALLLTDELWASLERLQKTLEEPPPVHLGNREVGSVKDWGSATRVPLPQSLWPASAEEPSAEPELVPEPDLEPEPEQVPAVLEQHRWPDTPTADICRAVVDQSLILGPAACCGLHALLPPTQQVSDWTLLYSSRRHGSSLETMLRCCQDQGPTVLAVRDTRGGTFGGFVSTNWPKLSQPSGWSGNGQCFLWAVDSSAVEPEVLKFGWTRRGNQFLWFARDAIGLGGGDDRGAYGLWLDKFLADGTTATCDVFDNPALCEVAKAEHQRSFSVEILEVWGIQD